MSDLSELVYKGKGLGRERRRNAGGNRTGEAIHTAFTKRLHDPKKGP